MITTKEDIANRSLEKNGANTISDIDSATDKNSLIMNRAFDQSRRLAIAQAYWCCSKRRVELSLTEDSRDVKWTKNNLIYTYDKPSDFIKLVGWSEPYQNVRDEGAYFVSDSNGGVTKISVNENTTATPAWLTSTGYTLGDYVLNDEFVYYCKAAHSSSASDEPGTGASWETYWTLMREESTGVWTASIEKNLGIIYIYDNTVITSYTPDFIEVFADRLTWDTCYKLTQSKTLTAEKKKDYEDTLHDARANNSQGQTPTAIRADAWTGAKYAGHNSWDDVGLYYR